LFGAFFAHEPLGKGRASAQSATSGKCQGVAPATRTCYTMGRETTMTDARTTQLHRPKIPAERYETSILHLALSALCYGVAVGGLLYALIALGAMPETVGYHFSASGTFDLYGDKSIAFLHPIIAEYLLLALFTFFAYVAGRVKPLKRFSPRANRLFCHLTVLICDLFSLSTVAVFSHWIACVAEQKPLDTEAIRVLLLIPAAVFVLYVVGLLVSIILVRTPLIRAKDRK